MPLLRPLRPVSSDFPINRRWGYRSSDYSLGYHTGTDFAAPTGTRVRSPRTGKVITSGYDTSYGYYVVVKDWLGRKAFLVAHLSRRSVVAGQRVTRGQTLGYSGDTGNATGPHVHAEQRHAPYGFHDTEKPDWER